MSTSKLLNSQIKPENRRYEPVRPDIYKIPFEVSGGSRSYVFKAQPFRILREITRAEYLDALPNGAIGGPKHFYYHIATD